MGRAQLASIPRGRTRLVVLGVLGAVAFGASGASASGVACAACSGTYTGSWSAQIQNTTPEGTVTYGVSLSWAETLSTPTGGNGASGVWSLTSAQGTVTFTNSGSPSDDCSATLSPNSALAADIGQSGPQVIEGSAVTVSAYPPTYWSGDPTQTSEPLVSSDDTDPGCDFTNALGYNSGFWTGFTGSDCHYAGTSAAEAMSFPVGTTTTMTDNCDGQGSDSFGATGTATLKSQLTLTAPGACTCACAAKAGAGDAHAAAASPLIVTPTGPVGYRSRPSGTWVSFKLVAYASGGCPPYQYSWQRGKTPPNSVVTPATGNTQTIDVTVKCPRKRRRNGSFYIPASCDNNPLTYTVRVTDNNGDTTSASIVIDSVFSRHQPYISPGDPAQRKQWIKTIEGTSDALAEQCAVAQRTDDFLADLDKASNLPKAPKAPTGSGALMYVARNCASENLRLLKQRFAKAGRALQVAKQDPPAQNFTAIAFAPELTAAAPAVCHGFQASVCDQVAQGELLADGELEQAILIGDAIATTIERHSGATYAGDQQAAAVQDLAYRAELAEVAQVLTLDNRDRASLATVLRRHGLDAQLRTAFASAPVPFLKQEASHLSGIRRATIEALLGMLQQYSPAIGPNFVADLSRPIPTGVLAAAGPLAATDLASLIEQLGAQNAIPGALVSILLGDVKGPASTLTADLGQLPPGVRALLQAAAGLTVTPL